VSYVRWLRDDALVSASTDSTLRCWELDRSAAGVADNSASAAAAGSGAGGDGVDGAHQQQGGGVDAVLSNPWMCTQVYQGHLNTKNFTGLGVEGAYIACGSETNEVVVYHQSMGQPSMRVQLGGTGGEGLGAIGDGGALVTAGCAAAAGAGQGGRGGGAGGVGQSVTALTWRRGSPVLLAANSQGYVFGVGMRAGI
jgi:hypothetical protein